MASCITGCQVKPRQIFVSGWEFEPVLFASKYISLTHKNVTSGQTHCTSAGSPEAICGWSGPACTDVGGVGGE